jgi:hypothetical protein
MVLAEEQISSERIRVDRMALKVIVDAADVKVLYGNGAQSLD